MSWLSVTNPLGARAERARQTLWLVRNFLYDYRRYSRESFLHGPKSRESRKAHIHLLAHTVEHGLSLANPRPAFGLEKIRKLVGETRSYIADYGIDASAEIAIRALEAYVAFNRAAGAEIGDVPATVETLRQAIVSARAELLGGTEDVTAEGIRQRASMDFLGFMEARHSVRQYADRPVDPALIEQAVRAAQQSPSSCNRQTCRVYAFTERKAIASVLGFQSGNRGFGEQLGGILIVTTDIRHWGSVGERYQGWIDGGMFAMTLALGLHAEGLGACMLNWSETKDVDAAMRAHVGIPDNELVITMIGFGHMPDSFKVPRSQRKPLDEILRLDPALPA